MIPTLPAGTSKHDPAAADPTTADPATADPAATDLGVDAADPAGDVTDSTDSVDPAEAAEAAEVQACCARVALYVRPLHFSQASSMPTRVEAQRGLTPGASASNVKLRLRPIAIA